MIYVRLVVLVICLESLTDPKVGKREILIVYYLTICVGEND